MLLAKRLSAIATLCTTVLACAPDQKFDYNIPPSFTMTDNKLIFWKIAYEGPGGYINVSAKPPSWRG